MPDAAAPALLEESLSEFYERAPCGYVTTHPDGTILRLNETLLGWLGCTRETVVGRQAFRDLLTVPGRIYHDSHYTPLLLMRGAAKEVAFELKTATGTLPVFVTSTLVRSEGGSPLAIRSTVFDATDRRRYERDLLEKSRELQVLNARKNQFMGVLAHDLRNPLCGFLVIAELLEEELGAQLSPGNQQLLTTIRDQSQGMLTMINDLLDVASIEAGQLRLSLAQADLRPLLERAVGLNRLLAAKKRIAVELELSDAPVLCRYDAGKLEQVINNLLGNAIKFSPPGSTVRVVLALEADAVSCAVQDQGPGLSPQELEQLFQPFVTGQARGTFGERSTGLGLAIAKRIVDGHQGRLVVSSSPGAGSTFTVRLPRPPREGA